MALKAYKGRIEQWSIHGMRVYGNLHDSPEGHPEGTGIITSKIESVVASRVETENSVYLLGKEMTI